MEGECSSIGRALDCGFSGCRFESFFSPFFTYKLVRNNIKVVKQLSMTYLTLYELLGSSKTFPFEATENSLTLSSPTISASSINLLQFTIPEGKLFYPEPFIASASYLHSDLTYLHLFQYWYWLWFLFIFLICFFLISFVSTLR